MTRRMGGVHKIDRVDEASSEHESPEPVNDRAREIWIVTGEGLGEGFTAREFRDGKTG